MSRPAGIGILLAVASAGALGFLAGRTWPVPPTVDASAGRRAEAPDPAVPPRDAPLPSGPGLEVAAGDALARAVWTGASWSDRSARCWRPDPP